MAETQAKKSFFDSPLMKTRIKKANVTLFPEAGLGYLVGPILALMANGVINIWLIQYWDKVLNLGELAPLFETLLPIISAIVIVIGNLFVGRLMERKPSMAGKARPLILLGMPVIAVTLLLLFLDPFGLIAAKTASEVPIMSLIFIAVGYNLYYAVGWPIYYTSHSALINLSTRDGGSRGLLSTLAMAAQLGAAGLSGMAGGLIVDLLSLLPVYSYVEDGVTKTVNAVTDLPAAVQAAGKDVAGGYTEVISRSTANEKWTVLMIVMIVCLVIGCLLEYYFTRERITEENVLAAQAASGDDTSKAPKKATMGEQIKVCVHDKYWWAIIIFFFLYQFGGQMKNNAMSFFSQATTGTNSVSSLINTVGAIPTCIGMALVWPIANKITKSKTCAWGGIVAFIAGWACLAVLGFQGNVAAVSGISVASFCVKALGTAPAMYISLALMANILDHQEAVHGIRTDGFTMALYGAIMVALPGVCNGIIAGINAITPAANKALVHTILAFGVEATCYLLMAFIMFFVNVEKFTKVDNEAIIADQKAAVLAAGGEWIDPETRAANEKAENDAIVEATRVEVLKAKCEKNGTNFEEENQAYLAQAAEKARVAEEKKAAAEAAKAAKEAAIPADVKAARDAKAAAAYADALADLNKAREAAGRPDYAPEAA